jgi:nitroreductase
MTETPRDAAPAFSAAFAAQFRDLVHWRRDVRRFRPDPLPAGSVERLIELACHAPSVGNCQPWRFALVASEDRRDAVRASFQRANRSALDGYDGEQRTLYAQLKLEGLERAPVHLGRVRRRGNGARGRARPPDDAGSPSLFSGRRDSHVVARGARRGHRARLGVDSRARCRDRGARRTARLDARGLSLSRLARSRNTWIPSSNAPGWQARADTADLVLRR